MYTYPSKKVWQGRVDSETDLLSFRYHQKVQLAGILNKALVHLGGNSFGIIGFKCDEGVRRNQGRVGAAEAPGKIKAALAQLPWHLADGVNVTDFGDLHCVNGRMEESQGMLGIAVAKILKAEAAPIILGGGHETFYGHYLGVRKAIGPDARIGIVSIDAHFDMQSYEEQSSAGTMLKQVADNDRNCGYLVCGVQRGGNALSLFETAAQHKVDVINEEELSNGPLRTVKGQLSAFAARHDHLILTLSADSFSFAFAPGVSMPSPLGLEPKLVRTLLRHIVASEKLLSFDLSDVNPIYDEQDKTVTLAAHLINDLLIKWQSHKRRLPPAMIKHQSRLLI